MERDGDLDAYWRRRVFILAGGLIILGLLAWALSGSGGTAPTAGARQSAAAQVRAANGLPAAAYGSMPQSQAVAAPSMGSAAAPGSPSASPGPSRSASARAQAKSRRGKVGQATAPRHGRRAAGLRAGALCPAGSVVMTLFSAKPSYVPGERPVFDVYAVSTAPVSCVFRFGPGAVRVLVSQHGRVVWDSAECRPATVARVHLARGAPVQMSVSWNRHAAYGCRGWLSSRASGRFTAVARTGSQSSPSTSFEIAR